MIFDPRRYPAMDDPRDHAIRLQRPQLLDQHLPRYPRDRAFQFGKSHGLAAEELEQDDQLPSLSSTRSAFCAPVAPVAPVVGE